MTNSVNLDQLEERPVLVVDYGAQYAQLIARRVREAGIYSEIVPHSMSTEKMLAKNPAAIVLSGGPSSVYADGAPKGDKALFEAGVPIFGICYGFQVMAQTLGGTVAQTGLREYGATDAVVCAENSSFLTGTRFEGNLTELELQWGRTIGQMPSPATAGNPLVAPYHWDQGP